MRELADPHPVYARLYIQMRPYFRRFARGGAKERARRLRADDGLDRFSGVGVAFSELFQDRLPEEITPPTRLLARQPYRIGAQDLVSFQTMLSIAHLLYGGGHERLTHALVIVCPVAHAAWYVQPAPALQPARL
jgi:hypothetical protein